MTQMVTRARSGPASWLARAGSPLAIAIIALAVYTAYALLQLAWHHWDVTSFITAGDLFVHRADLTAPISILPDSPGYDGEFYYRLGLDPFTNSTTAFGITLDNPSTRMARIGYPLLVWAASFGQAGLLPWAMVGVNLAGLFAIAWISAAIARANGLPAWMGLAPAFYPGFILTLTRDTTEIVATTFALAGLALAMRRAFWRAAPFAAFAVVTRETTLFYLAGFGLVELVQAIRQRRWSWGIVALAVPAAVFAAWQWTIIQMWGASSYSGTGQNIGLPFEGMKRFFASDLGQILADPWMSYAFKLHIYYAAAALMCVAVCVLAGFGAVTARAGIRAIPVQGMGGPTRAGGDADRSVPGAIPRQAGMANNAGLGLKVSWALYVLLIICLTTSIWIQPYDFLRAFTDCFVTGTTLIMLTGLRRLWAPLIAMVVPIWILTAWFTFR